MEPIFELPAGPGSREVRVGDAAFQVRDVTLLLTSIGLTPERPVYVIEAPVEVGQQNGWERRLDLERLRKHRYEAMGAGLAESMHQADGEHRKRDAAQAAAAADAAAREADRQHAERVEQERLAAEAAAAAAAAAEKAEDKVTEDSTPAPASQQPPKVKAPGKAKEK